MGAKDLALVEGSGETIPNQLLTCRCFRYDETELPLPQLKAEKLDDSRVMPLVACTRHTNSILSRAEAYGWKACLRTAKGPQIRRTALARATSSVLIVAQHWCANEAPGLHVAGQGQGLCDPG